MRGRLARALGLALWALLATAPAAEAGPVGAAIGALVSSFGAAWAAIGATAIGAIAQNLILSVGLSAIGRAFQKKPAAQGVRRTVELGGDKPQRTILGLYASAGHLIYAGSHGSSRAYFTEVIVLSVLPGVTLRRVAVNGAWCTLGATAHPDYGLPVEEFEKDGTDHLWIKFHGNGRTTADPMLVAKYGSDPDRPWTSDMVGRGLAFAIVTSRWSDELHRGQTPKVLFEVDGIPVYSRRLDGTAGGSGTQRRDDRATWAQGRDPVAAIETLLGPGLRYDGEQLYGPALPARAFPASSWVAASAACVLGVTQPEGGTKPAYQFGAEIDLSTEPAAVVLELLKACAGDIALCGDRLLVHVGPAGAPAMSLTDADCSVEDDQELDPFRGVEETFNGATATYPDPRELWANSPAPQRLYPAWEAEDGGRRQLADLDYPWVPFEEQVQRLMVAVVADERKGRSHRVLLPPRFGQLEPVEDYLAWTSARNGYASKLFKITEVVDLVDGWVAATILEEDPDDYDWAPGQVIATAPPIPVLPTLTGLGVPGWAVAPVILTDATGTARRPGLRMTWDAADLDGVEGLRWERRVQGQAAVVPGSLSGIAAEQAVISDGIIPLETYEVRAVLVAPGQATLWTAWTIVTAPDVRLSTGDIDPGFHPGDDGGPPATPNGLAVTAGIRMLWLNWALGPEADLSHYEVYEHTATTPAPTAGTPATWTAPGNGFARMGLGDGVTRHYWVRAVDTSGLKSGWSARAQGTTTANTGVTAATLAGLINATSFAAGIAAVEIVAALPATGNFAGRMAFLTTDAKLYRHTGTPADASGWTRATDGADLVADSVVAGKIAAGAVSTEQLAADAVTAEKMLLIDRENQVPIWSFVGIRPSADPAGPSLLVVSGSYTVAGGAPSGNQAIELGKASAAATTRIATPVGQRIACKPGDVLWLDTEARAMGGAISAGFYARVTFYGADKVTEVGSAGFQNVALTTSWSGSMSMQVTAPGTARFYGVEVFNHANNATTRTIQVDRVVVRRANAAELVVDGTITAEKLSASEIITSSAQIGDGIITTAKIGDAEVQTLKIAGRAVTIPVYQYVSCDLDVANTSSWLQLAKLRITKVAGYGVLFGLSLPFAGYGTGLISIGIFRGTALIAERMAPTGSKGSQATISFTGYDSDTSAGAKDYYVKAKKKVSGDHKADLVIEGKVFFSLLETMR